MNAKEHIAFGRGAHSCPGGPLARAEGRISIERILKRTRNIRLSEEHHGPKDIRVPGQNRLTAFDAGTHALLGQSGAGADHVARRAHRQCAGSRTRARASSAKKNYCRCPVVSLSQI